MAGNRDKRTVRQNEHGQPLLSARATIVTCDGPRVVKFRLTKPSKAQKGKR